MAGVEAARVYATVGADIDQLKSGMRDAEAAVNKFASEASEASGKAESSIKKIGDGADDAARKVEGASTRGSTAMRGIGDAAEVAGVGVGGLGNNFDQFNSKSGAAVVGFGGFAAILGSSLAVGVDFEKALNGVASSLYDTSLSAEENTANLAALRKEALGVGADTSKSASEAVVAFGELAKSGVSVKDIVGGAGRTVVELSEATGGEMQEMASLVSNALNVFKVGADGAGDAANVMAKAANASSIDINDMARAMSSGGLAASGAGLDIEDFSTALGIMGNQGLKGADAGTSLKSMLAGLTPVSKEAKQAFADLGIEVFDAEGKFKPFEEILVELSDGFAGMTEKQRASTAELLFGSDGIRAFNALVPESTGLVDEYGNAISNTAAQWDAFGTSVEKQASIQDQSRLRMEGAAGANEKLKGSIETLQIEMTQNLVPALTKGAEGASWFLNEVQASSKGFDEFQSKMKNADLGAKAWDELKVSAGNLFDFLKTPVEVPFLDDVKTWPGKVGGWLGEMKDKFTEKFGEIKDGAAENITDAWTDISAEVGTWPQKAYDALVDLPAKVKDKFEELKTGATEKLTETWTAVSEKVGGWPEALFEELSELASKGRERFENLKTDATTTITDTWSEVSKEVSTWPSKVHTALADLASQAKSRFEEVKTGVTTLITETWGNVSTEIGTWPGKVTSGLSGIAKAFGDRFDEAKRDVKSAVTTAWADVTTEIGGWAGKATTSLGGLAGAFGTAGRNAAQALLQPMQSLAGQIEGIINNILAKARSAANTIKNILPGGGGGDGGGTEQAYNQSTSDLSQVSPYAGEGGAPASGVLSQAFGKADGSMGYDFHTGIDIAGSAGSPIVAANGGRVAFSGWDGGYGQSIVVDHGGGWTSRYGHMTSLARAVGDIVGEGGLLGLMGSTGNSSGPHLHYEEMLGGRHVDPLRTYSDGGWITEPVLGIGASGSRYLLGENGNEYVSRGGTMGEGQVVHYHIEPGAVVIPAADLAEMKSVSDFFARLEQAARAQGE